MSSRLKDLYNTEIREQMTKKFGYTNIMQVPKLDKIVVNMGVGEARENEKLLEAHRKLQDQRRYADRLQGYTSWRQNVRVP